MLGTVKELAAVAHPYLRNLHPEHITFLLLLLDRRTSMVATLLGAEDDEKSVFGFLQKEEVWKRHTTTGTPPGMLVQGACTSVGDVIYMYGDYNSRSEVQGGLYSLDVREMKWSKVSNGPRLGRCGIAHRKNKLVVFGGFGDSGRSNELHIFDLEEGEECACVVCLSIEHNASIIGDILG